MDNFEKLLRQKYAKIIIDGKTFIPMIVDGIEHWYIDSQGCMPFINKIDVFCSTNEELNILVGKGIEFINSDPKHYYGYSANIREINKTIGIITFVFDTDSFNFLIDEHISLG